MSGIYIVYPEKRYVRFDILKGWYDDAVANGKIDPSHAGAKDLKGIVAGLSDAGVITQGRDGCADKTERGGE